MPKKGLFGGITPFSGVLRGFRPSGPDLAQGFYINPSRRGPVPGRGLPPRAHPARPWEPHRAGGRAKARELWLRKT